jgi:hypothetical protein
MYSQKDLKKCVFEGLFATFTMLFVVVAALSHTHTPHTHTQKPADAQFVHQYLYESALACSYYALCLLCAVVSAGLTDQSDASPET